MSMRRDAGSNRRWRMNNWTWSALIKSTVYHTRLYHALVYTQYSTFNKIWRRKKHIFCRSRSRTKLNGSRSDTVFKCLKDFSSFREKNLNCQLKLPNFSNFICFTKSAQDPNMWSPIRIRTCRIWNRIFWNSDLDLVNKRILCQKTVTKFVSHTKNYHQSQI